MTNPIPTLKRLKDGLFRIWDGVPLTMAGALLLAGSLLVHRSYGRNEADYVLFAASAVSIGWIALSACSVLLGTLRIRLWMNAHALDLQEESITGVPLNTGLSLPGFRRWPFVQLSIAWISPRPVDVHLKEKGALLSEVITPRERGRFEGVTRRLEVRDIFGLTRIRTRHRVNGSLVITPRPGHVEIGVLARHTSGDAFSHPSGRAEGDRIEMRRYAHGDPMRHILWKVFARSRTLMVRTPERAISASPSMAAYMVTGEHDEATATTARVAMEGGLLGKDWVFSADGAHEVTRHPDVALDQIIRSVDHRAHAGENLTLFRRQIDAEMLAQCVLFAPPTSGAWIENVIAFAGELPHQPIIVISLEHVPTSQRRRPWRERLWSAAPEPGVPHDQVSEVIQRLTKAGLDTRVLHSESGRMIPAAHFADVRGA